MDIDFLDVRREIQRSSISYSVNRVNASIFLPRQTGILELFEALLQKGFNSRNGQRPINGQFARSRKFTKENYESIILYDRTNPLSILPGAQIVLLQPCAEFLEEIKSILLAISGLRYNLCRVELAIDFYPFSYLLKEFFDYFLVLKWSRAKLKKWYEEDGFPTSYVGQSGHHKICAAYGDIDEDDNSLLRVEIRLFTPTIKSRSLDLVPNAYNNIDLSKILSFKYFDRRAALKTVENYLKRNNFPDKDIYFLKRMLLPPTLSKSPIMDIKYHIRNRKVRFINIYRHIKPINELDFFISQLGSVNFLPNAHSNSI